MNAQVYLVEIITTKRVICINSLMENCQQVIVEDNKEEFITKYIKRKLHIQLYDSDVCNPKGTLGTIAKKIPY